MFIMSWINSHVKIQKLNDHHLHSINSSRADPFIEKWPNICLNISPNKEKKSPSRNQFYGNLPWQPTVMRWHFVKVQTFEKHYNVCFRGLIYEMSRKWKNFLKRFTWKKDQKQRYWKRLFPIVIEYLTSIQYTNFSLLYLTIKWF